MTTRQKNRLKMKIEITKKAFLRWAKRNRKKKFDYMDNNRCATASFLRDRGFWSSVGGYEFTLYETRKSARWQSEVGRISTHKIPRWLQGIHKAGPDYIHALTGQSIVDWMKRKHYDR